MIKLNLFILLIIAISLSMDAFSLSLAYGTLDIDKKNIITLSIIVGVYHFLMPILGFFIGSKVFQFIPIASNFIVFIILVLIGIEMIIDTIKQNETMKKMYLLQMIVFGFTVSIDSFSVGLGIDNINKNIILSSIIFSITSFIFTIIGLFIGKKINQIFGKISTLIGGCVLILIAVLYVA